MFGILIINILVSSAISEDGFLSVKIDLIKLEEYEPENMNETRIGNHAEVARKSTNPPSDSIKILT